jgi:uroporphyrinogen III methyltransferase/synthase
MEYKMNNNTQVYLVGAGPGDTGLITVKGLQCLQKADVVLYDKLSNPAFLQETPATAELIYVGKIKDHHSMPQEEINKLLVSKAREGKIVVRLKGGDPYIFGRGGEEALQLAEDGIRFEVIPGITSGFAASTYAGIPLTHRDFTTNVSLITGHVKTSKNQFIDINWPSLATNKGTLVFYMGLSNIDSICEQLLLHGRSADTPVAVISRATTANQQTVVATLKDAPQRVVECNVKPPALIIVGEVVSLRQQLRWFDTKPLFGQRILIPHTQAGSTKLSDQLKDLGAETIRIKVMDDQPPSCWQALDQAIEQLAQVNLLVLKNPACVDGLWQRLKTANKDTRALAHLTIVSCGCKTTQALRNKGIEADQVINAEELKDGGALIASLPQQQTNGVRILCPTADGDTSTMLQTLQQAGAIIEQPAAYATRCTTTHRDYLIELLKTEQLTSLCLTSAASTSALAELLGSETPLLSALHTVAMGPATEHAAQQCGIGVDTCSDHPTSAAVVASLLESGEKDNG